MNVLLISEHYFPKIGGTVSYVENTAVNLAKKGIKVHLLVPDAGEIGKIQTDYSHPEDNLILLKLGVTINSIEFNPVERKNLCNWIKDNIVELTRQYDIKVVHLLFGLFIANILDTKTLKENGIKTFNTIHNIPPFECSNSWKDDAFHRYMKDEIRKIGVRLVNKRRIKNNDFDYYIVPSSGVKHDLSKYINPSKTYIIGHGGAEYIIRNGEDASRSNTQIKILTVGGVIPHKKQHLIPEIAKYLKKDGIEFKWDIVGPIRNQRYYNYVKNLIKEENVQNNVIIHNNVSNDALRSFYQNASIYIQLSSEEGFCMTVLDAIAYGLPVMGTPAGAIPEMLEMVEGTIIENNLNTLKKIITHYIRIKDNLKTDSDKLELFSNTYTWENAANQLISLYNG